MAFDLQKLVPIGGQTSTDRAPAVWSYRTDVDAGAAIQVSGYMNAAASRLVVGDYIFAYSTTDVRIHYVVTNTGSVVDLTDGFSINTANSN